MAKPFETIPYYPGDAQDYRTTLPTRDSTVLNTDLLLPTVRLVRAYSASAHASLRRDSMQRIVDFCSDETRYIFLKDFVRTQIAVVGGRENPDPIGLSSYANVLETVQARFEPLTNFRARILLFNHRGRSRKDYEDTKEMFRREFTAFFVPGQHNTILQESGIQGAPPYFNQGFRRFHSFELAYIFDNLVRAGGAPSSITREMVENTISSFKDRLAAGILRPEQADTVYLMAFNEVIDELLGEYGLEVINEPKLKDMPKVDGISNLPDYKVVHRAFQNWIAGRDESVAEQMVTLAAECRKESVRTNLFVIRGDGHIYLKGKLQFNLLPVVDMAESSQDAFTRNYPGSRKRIELLRLAIEGKEVSETVWRDAFREYRQFGYYP